MSNIVLYAALAVAILVLSGCAAKERAVIESVSDNGCRIDKVETSTGPRGRSAIIVECK